MEADPSSDVEWPFRYQLCATPQNKKWCPRWKITTTSKTCRRLDWGDGVTPATLTLEGAVQTCQEELACVAIEEEGCEGDFGSKEINSQ